MSRYFLEAASKGDLEKVTALLDNGVDVDAQEKKTGLTVLCQAALNGHLAVARLLLERGADLNRRDSSMGLTPVGWAAERGHVELVEYFLQAGADPNLPTHQFLLTPLMMAAKRGDVAIVKLLLAAGANVQATTVDGRSALTMAQEHKRTDVARVLVEAGATPPAPLAEPTTIPWPSVDETGESCDYSAPEKVLRGFIYAMNLWEKEAARLGKSGRTGPDVNQLIRDKMQKVFDVFCTPRDRPYGRQGSYSKPPGYGPEAEVLIDVTLVSARRAEMITRESKTKREFLYVALRQKGRWLLDNKKWCSIGTQEWMSWSL